MGTAGDDRDRLGFEENRDYLRLALGRLVPQPLARRAVAVSVTTDRTRTRVGEPIEVTVEFRNRLPIPIAVETPHRRLWGWRVDGRLAAGEQGGAIGGTTGSFAFRARERKRFRRRWDGTFAPEDGHGFREPAAPGEHEIEAYLAIDSRSRPSDAATVEIER